MPSFQGHLELFSRCTCTRTCGKVFLMHFFALQVPPRPSHDTVTRILKDLGFSSRRAVKRPLLTARHRRLRKEFAAKFSRWGPQKWRDIIFTDEKIFRVRPGGLVRCWKQVSDKKFAAKYVIPQVQRPEGVMVWAGMNGLGQIKLMRCPPKVKSADYQTILGQVKSFISPRYDYKHFWAHIN